jgi:amidase
MSRTVADAALLLGALAGFDDSDAPTGIPHGAIFNDYTQFLEANGLEDARIGIAREMLGFNPLVDKYFDEAVELLKERGAIVIDPITFPHRQKWGAPSYQVLLYEFKDGLDRYLSQHAGAGIRSLEELITFNETHADREMPWFGQEIFKLAQAKGDLTEAEYLEALANSKLYTQAEGIDTVMNKHNLDAIIAGTNGPAWNIDWVNGDHFSGSSSSPAAISGYPNICVPMGEVHGLPVGISFFGRAWSEPVLLRIAYAYEQASKHRKVPMFTPSILV